MIRVMGKELVREKGRLLSKSEGEKVKEERTDQRAPWVGVHVKEAMVSGPGEGGGACVPRAERSKRKREGPTFLFMASSIFLMVC